MPNELRQPEDDERHAEEGEPDGHDRPRDLTADDHDTDDERGEAGDPDEDRGAHPEWPKAGSAGAAGSTGRKGTRARPGVVAPPGEAPGPTRSATGPAVAYRARGGAARGSGTRAGIRWAFPAATSAIANAPITGQLR